MPQRGGVFKSTDAGLTWNFIGLPNIDIYSLAVNENFLYAGSFYDGVFRTSNDGATWAQINQGLTSNWMKTIVMYKDILYAGTFSGLYSSIDNGDNWNLSAFDNAEVNSLVILDSILFAGTNTGVYVLGENDNWKQTGLSDNIIYSMTTIGHDLIAGGYPGISISTDHGNSWNSIKKNIPDAAIQAIDHNDKYLFAGTSLNGIWRIQLSEITSISDEESISLNIFWLAQNFPNPFNPSTVIRYSIPSVEALSKVEALHVSLKVYDVLGNEVTTLVNENQQAGNYEVKFDGSKLASGVYLYRLNINDYSSTKKMILLR